MTNKSCWLSFYFCLHDSFLTCFLQWSLSPVYDTEMHWIWESSWDSPGEALRKRVWAVLIVKVSIRRLYSMRGRKSWGGEQEVNKHLVCQFHSNLLNPLQPTQWAAGITACTCGSASPSSSVGFASIWLQIEGQGTAERRPQMGPIWFSCDHSNRAIYWLCCAEMEHLRSRSLVVLLGDRSGWDLSVFFQYTPARCPEGQKSIPCIRWLSGHKPFHCFSGHHQPQWLKTLGINVFHCIDCALAILKILPLNRKWKDSLACSSC